MANVIEAWSLGIGLCGLFNDLGHKPSNIPKQTHLNEQVMSSVLVFFSRSVLAEENFLLFTIL